MQNHLFHNNLARILHPQSNHRQAIPNQHDIDPGRLRHMRTREIMCCQHGDRFALFVQVAQRLQGDLFAGVGGGGSHGGMGAVSSGDVSVGGEGWTCVGVGVGAIEAG